MDYQSKVIGWFVDYINDSDSIVAKVIDHNAISKANKIK